jgi:hypothetical protein
MTVLSSPGEVLSLAVAVWTQQLQVLDTIVKPVAVDVMERQ